MAAGDVTLFGPYKATDKTAIAAGLTVGATDSIISWTSGANQVMFAVVERA